MNRNNETMDLIIETLKNNGAMFRDEMVKKTGLPRTTIYDNMNHLIQQGIIIKYKAQRCIGAKGRPRILFHYQGVN